MFSRFVYWARWRIVHIKLSRQAVISLHSSKTQIIAAMHGEVEHGSALFQQV